MKDETFPNVPQALLLVLALLLLMLLAFAVLSTFRSPLGLSESETSALAQVLGYGLLLATLLHAKSMSYRELVDPGRASMVAMLVLVGMPVVATVPLMVLFCDVLGDLLAWIFPLSAWEQQAFERMSASNLAAITVACVLAPVLEEMLFRGVILRAFLHQYARPTAIGLSAVIFGAVHLNIYQFCVAFVLGLYLGWLYERTRSLVPCILFHAVYNSLVSMVETGRSQGSGAERLVSGALAWVLAAALAVAGALVLVRVLGLRGERPAGAHDGP